METKKCNKCKEVLPREDFNRRTRGPDGLQSVCRNCQHKRDAALYLSNRTFRRDRIHEQRNARKQLIREFLKQAKNKPCSDCGQQFMSCQMDFDHVSGTKTFDLSKASTLLPTMEVILEEIAKCELVCANCHRLRTFNRRIRTAGITG